MSGGIDGTQLALLWLLGALLTAMGAVFKVGWRAARSYWLVAVLLGPVSVLYLLLDRRKRCPFCAHSVARGARVCDACGHRLVYTHP